MTRLSSKGQLTVPADVRQHLGLQPGDKIRFTPVSGSSVVVLERVPDAPGKGLGYPKGK